METSISLAIPMFICAFMATYILLFYNRENRAQRSILWIYIATFIIFLVKALMNAKVYSPIMNTIYVIAILAVYPTAYHAIVLFCKGKMSVWQNFLLFLPSAVLGLAVGICYLYMDKAATDEFIAVFAGNFNAALTTPAAVFQGMLHSIVSVVYLVEIVIIVIFGTRLIFKYDRLLLRFYSNISRRTMRPVAYALWLIALVSFGTTLVEIMVIPNRVEANWWATIFSIMLCVALAGFGLIILRKKHSAVDKDRDTILCEQNADDIQAEANPERIKSSVSMMMNIQQLYTNPDLQISDLAWKLNVSCDWLAKFIEQQFGLTFFDMVTRRRITRAQTILAAPRELLLDAVIEQAWHESGFKSRAEMNAIFRTFNLPPPQKN